MKTVKFETVRELALALLDGRRFRSEDNSVDIEFNEKMGPRVFHHSGRVEYLEHDSWVGAELTEIPTPRHHAELIKAWADDGSLKLQWFMSYGNNEDLWRDSPTSGDFYEGNSLRLVGNGGEVIMVSESKK